MRALRGTLALLVLIAILLIPDREHSPLDPDEPIAADGSSAAGLARTIFDFDPFLGAFGETQPPPDPDDPWEFRARFELESEWVERSRDAIFRMLGPIDWSLCDPARHGQLVGALRTYYGARGRQKASFTLRGPRATAFVEQMWSTPFDQQVDRFACQLVESGFLQSR